MTAEEMFKTEGFNKERESNYSISYVRKFIYKSMSTIEIIAFYKKDKSFIAAEYSSFGDEYGRPMDIGIDLYKAINKEMEELGWINS